MVMECSVLEGNIASTTTAVVAEHGESASWDSKTTPLIHPCPTVILLVQGTQGAASNYNTNHQWTLMQWDQPDSAWCVSAVQYHQQDFIMQIDEDRLAAMQPVSRYRKRPYHQSQQGTVQRNNNTYGDFESKSHG